MVNSILKYSISSPFWVFFFYISEISVILNMYYYTILKSKKNCITII